MIVNRGTSSRKVPPDDQGVSSGIVHTLGMASHGRVACQGSVSCLFIVVCFGDCVMFTSRVRCCLQFASRDTDTGSDQNISSDLWHGFCKHVFLINPDV